MTDNTAATADQPKAIECRFAVYSKSNADQDYRDLHLIKENIHNVDGTTTPNVKLEIDYKRPFWVTKKGMQNHKDKKEWTPKENLHEFQSTQSQLANNVAKALGKSWMKNPNLRDLADSPYLYGSDILSTSVIKQSYTDRWDIQTPYSNAVYDTETDVVWGHGQIQMATISFKDRVFTAVQKDFVAGYPDPINKIKNLAEKYIGNFLKERNVVLEIVIVDREIDVVKTTLAKAHEWKPDLLSVWNLAFDMDKIIEACERAGIDPATLMSDPAVPKEFQSFRFKKGPAKKVTASGRVMNFKPAQRWHTVFCPSSFYWVDAMGIYRQVRITAPEESSYALDHLLQKNLKDVRKLKFEEADGLVGLEWHKFMQSKYPLEYVVYNIFDCVSMEILDEKILDVCLSFPMFAGCTDFSNFNSQPKRAVNELHFFVQKHGQVIGSTAAEMANEMDEETASLDGWIVMLPSHLVADNGLQIIEEHPDLRTNIRIHVGDLDVAASYPNGEVVFNISKETTSKELLKIEGIPEEVQRMATINLSGGRTNSVEFCVALYGLPNFDRMLDAFRANRSAPRVEELMASVPVTTPVYGVDAPETREQMVRDLTAMSQRMMEESISNPSPLDREVPLSEYQPRKVTPAY